jgi:hypothetical protein
MSLDRPAADAREQARAALAALPPSARAFLEALHAEYFPPRADGGMAYRLEDLLCHLADGDRHGVGDGWLARALAVPVAYLAVVRVAAGLAAPPHKEAEPDGSAANVVGLRP